MKEALRALALKLFGAITERWAADISAEKRGTFADGIAVGIAAGLLAGWLFGGA